MATFGGVLRFTIAGTPLVLRGKIDIDPSSIDKAEITNLDGSVSYSAKLKAFMAEVTFEDNIATDWNAMMLAPPSNITIIEDQAGMMHLFTDASFSGTPKIDSETGQVSGLKVTSSRYQRVAS